MPVCCQGSRFASLEFEDRPRSRLDLRASLASHSPSRPILAALLKQLRFGERNERRFGDCPNSMMKQNMWVCLKNSGTLLKVWWLIIVFSIYIGSFGVSTIFGHMPWKNCMYEKSQFSLAWILRPLAPPFGCRFSTWTTSWCRWPRWFDRFEVLKVCRLA